MPDRPRSTAFARSLVKQDEGNRSRGVGEKEVGSERLNHGGHGGHGEVRNCAPRARKKTCSVPSVFEIFLLPDSPAPVHLPFSTQGRACHGGRGCACLGR